MKLLNVLNLDNQMLLRLVLIISKIKRGLVLTSMVIFLSTFILPAQQGQQKRLALVIGNGNYESSILPNPENDAKAIRVALQKVGFTVIEYENLGLVPMKRAIDDFGMKLKSNDVGLFFYAGHGIQSKGYNYLIPVDAQLKSEEDVEYNCVEANRVLAKMEASGSKVNIVILDACRNNPFERSWSRASASRGLAFMDAPSGTLIAYSTAPGRTASDGNGSNSPYTSAILESMKIPDITIIQMFQTVRIIVTQKSGNQQIPWESTSMTGDFYFNPGISAASEGQSKKAEPVSNTAASQLPSSNTSIQVVTQSDKASSKPAVLNETNPKQSITDKTTTRTTPSEEIAFRSTSTSFVQDQDRERYKIVTIGTQVWMKENLRTTKYNDGTSIPLITDGKTWKELSTPAYCWYDDDAASQKGTYGALYNWYTVNTGKLCPKGWHVPSDAEWATLTTFLGGESVAGGKLKEAGTAHWIKPNKGSTNETAFTSLPGGYRHFDGTYYYVGGNGYWWSSSENTTEEAWGETMSYGNAYVYRSFGLKKNGFSVRCLQDN